MKVKNAYFIKHKESTCKKIHGMLVCYTRGVDSGGIIAFGMDLFTRSLKYMLVLYHHRLEIVVHLIH